MSKANAIRAGRAYVELFTEDSAFVRGLDKAKARLTKWADSLTSIGTRLGATGLAIGTPLLVAAKQFADAGSLLADAAARTGASVEALSELGFAAEQSGTDFVTLEGSLRKMQKLLAEAAGGSKSANETLSELGLTVAQLVNLQPDQQIELFAERIKRIENPAKRTAIALELFGKSGAQLLPLLNTGAVGIRALREQARKLGLTMSTADAQAAEEFGDALDILGKVTKRAVFEIGSALSPALMSATRFLTGAAKSAAAWIRENKTLVTVLLYVSAATLVTAAGFLTLGTLLRAATVALTVFKAVAAGTVVVFNLLAPAIAALASPAGLVVAAIVGIGLALLKVTGLGEKLLSFLGNAFKTLAADAIQAWQGIGDALAAGDLGLAAKIAWLTIKLEWERGIAWISEKWLDFKSFFVTTWTEATYGLASIFIKAVSGIQSIWNDITAGMAAGWEHFTSGAVGLWTAAQNEISQAFVDLWSLFDDTVDAAGTKATLQGDYEAQQKKDQAAKEARLQQIEAERAAQQQQIDADRSGTLDALEQDRQRAQAKRQAAYDAELKATDDQLQSAKDEWRTALDEAAKKRAAAEAGLGLPKLEQIDLEGIDAGVFEVKKKQEIQGTFNPAALRYFDSKGWQDRTAKATEETAKNTKRLVQVTLDNKLAFV